jgi:L-threonylcarbamoyladenylate synthase
LNGYYLTRLSSRVNFIDFRLKNPHILGMILSSTKENIKQAATLLKQSKIVAFPTETVYGLGAVGSDDYAVAKIYTLKNRPKINPLIFHCLDFSWVKEIAQVSPLIEKVANYFMQGPLTLVLNQKESSTISKLATAGLNTIAVRVPVHPIARELIEKVGEPLVAPSANLSGRLSSTQANHVEEFFKSNIEAILDGGDCYYGLESTILDLSIENNATILRQGAVALETLEEILEKDISIGSNLDKIKSPGQLKRHYSPQLPLRINAVTQQDEEAYIGFGDMSCTFNLSPNNDLTEAAANLFKYLHEADNPNFFKGIAVAPIPMQSIGVAINDRLFRACHQGESDE